MRRLWRFFGNEAGQDLVEYSLILAFVALASAGLFVNAGQGVQGIWASAGGTLNNGQCPYTDLTPEQQAAAHCHY